MDELLYLWGRMDKSARIDWLKEAHYMVLPMKYILDFSYWFALAHLISIFILIAIMQ